MNYSIHTIGIRKELRNLMEYYDTLERLYKNGQGRYRVFPDNKNDDYHATIFEDRGIRVLLRKTPIGGYMIFILSLNDLIGTDDKLSLIQPESLQSALDSADDMLTGEFGENYSINNLELYRVDYCINVEVDSPENVREYIKQLYRTDMKKGYKLTVSDNFDFDVNKGFTARNMITGTEISFYDKQKQLEQRSYDSEQADGILRVELRLLTWKTVVKHTPGCRDNRERVAYCMNSSRQEILDIVRLILPDGDYYTIKKACAIVKKSVKKEKLRNRMIEMLRLTRKHSSVRIAKEKLFEKCPKLRHDYFDKMMVEFERIGVNVVTLEKDSEVKCLPSLFRYLK